MYIFKYSYYTIIKSVFNLISSIIFSGVFESAITWSKQLHGTVSTREVASNNSCENKATLIDERFIN